MKIFSFLTFPFFQALVNSLPVLLISASGLTILGFLRAGQSIRLLGIRLVFAVAGFCLLDALMLIALPRLGFSFGKPSFSLFLFSLGRVVGLGLFGIWMIGASRLGVDRHSSLPFWLGNIIFTVLLFYSLFLEPFHVRVSQIQLEVPAGQISRSIRIVQLSDIHVERTTHRERKLVELVRGLQPDLIVLTGDYLNLSYLADPEAIQDLQSLLAQLEAPFGIYAVNGSLETTEQMEVLFSGLNITILKDEVSPVTLPEGKIFLVGVNDQEVSRDGEVLRRLAQELPENAFSLLLHHTPDLAQTAAETGMDLYLAGHTHGGQVRIPFYGAIVTSSIYDKMYEAGRYDLLQTTLYVSSGLGMEGGVAPRMRFLTPPEVVVVDLVPGE